MAAQQTLTGEEWPALPYEEWKDTLVTLHMWTQIVGKVKLALVPFLNDWWQVPFSVAARGLTTSTIPLGSRVYVPAYRNDGHGGWFLFGRLAFTGAAGQNESEQQWGRQSCLQPAFSRP